MKKNLNFLPILLFALSVVFVSCSPEDEENLGTLPNDSAVISKSENPEVDLANLKSAVQGFISSVNIEELSNGINTFDSEVQASTYLQPIIDETLAVLPEYGISTEELQENISDLNDPRIAIIGIGIVTIDSGVQNLQVKSVDWDRAIGCALSAIGFNSIDLIRNAAQTGTRLAIRSLIRTVAVRLLGPIGVAFTVAEWAVCYAGWW